jgi:formylglycine-generating enzyme required for sulfatase activity
MKTSRVGQARRHPRYFYMEGCEMARKVWLAAVVALIGLLCGAGFAGSDESLDWVNKHLGNGRCEIARIMYEDAYINADGGRRDAEIERRLKACVEGVREGTAKPAAAKPAPPAAPPVVVAPPPSTANATTEMVYVRGGTFTMGCTAEQGKDCLDNEKPAHEVTVGDFYIGKYEVTQAEWKAVMGNNPSNFKGDNLPVEKVNWNDVQEFIRKLNTTTGKNYRLPTEAEWEYAARGGSQSWGFKYSGSNSISDVAWYRKNSGSKTHPVGMKRANELGIYDMSGNVYELVNDWYGDYSSGSQTNPVGPSSGSRRVFRGGSWIIDARHARVSFRFIDLLGYRFDSLGFRLASSSR